MFNNSQKEVFLKNGKLTEKLFAKLFNDPIFSNSTEDQLEHWDVKFDVKGLKKIRRIDDNVNENLHYIEIKGITGKDGWAYGSADFFAFELIKYWVFVYKKDLQLFISNNIIKEYCDSPQLYKLYQRRGRKDVLTLITLADLIYIGMAIEPKIQNP